MEEELKRIGQIGKIVLVALMGIAVGLLMFECDGHAQYQGNLGPNQQVQQPPLNPGTQSIHPK